jgi:hypothetical protein
VTEDSAGCWLHHDASLAPLAAMRKRLQTTLPFSTLTRRVIGRKPPQGLHHAIGDCNRPTSSTLGGTDKQTCCNTYSTPTAGMATGAMRGPLIDTNMAVNMFWCWSRCLHSGSMRGACQPLLECQVEHAAQCTAPPLSTSQQQCKALTQNRTTSSQVKLISTVCMNKNLQHDICISTEAQGRNRK